MPNKPLSDPIPVRLPTEILADIEAIAETCERTRSWVMVRALRMYIAGEGAEILAVRQGRAQAADGKVHDLDIVLMDLRRILENDAA